MKHKTRTKALSWLLSLALALTLMPALGGTARAADPVGYRKATVDETTHAVSFTDETCTDYTTVTDSTTDVTWNSGWYVVSGNVTIVKRITVTGTVNLILCDSATLTASEGITVRSGNTLNIYGQSSGTGTLTATGTGSENRAGIGGGYQDHGGSVTINGGTVTATGCKSGAGIGGGWSGNGGNVTINGGTVNATGGSQGAGIGGGWNGNGGTVTINGGTVTATGGSQGGAGIGGGLNPPANSAGKGGTVTINGGTVTATGGAGAVGIGKGNSPFDYHGTLTLGDGMYLYGGNAADSKARVRAGQDGSYARSLYMEVNSETPHGHSFTYSAEGNTITATCSASGCDLQDNEATLSIVPPDPVCDAVAKPATLEGDLLEFDPLPDIVYTKNDEVLNAVPNSEGNYTASITLGEATAKVDYELIDPYYTITIPATLNVANTGWNETAGITATGRVPSGKVLGVIASSANGWLLKSDEESVAYTLCKAKTDTKTGKWIFDDLSETPSTLPLGINVSDYSDKPAGNYQDIVTFTAVVKKPAKICFSNTNYAVEPDWPNNSKEEAFDDRFTHIGDGTVTFSSTNENAAKVYYKNESLKLWYSNSGSAVITAAVDDTDEYVYYDNEVTCTVNASCVAEGTLVTLADGTQAPIETLKPGDMVMTWSFWNGGYEAQPVTLLYEHGAEAYTVLTLIFSDGTAVDTINGHGFYSTDINDYAFIAPQNVGEYIGGHFIRRAADGSNEIVTLVDASMEDREVGCYSLQTAYNENFMAENMLSITMEYVPGRYHYFDIGDNMVYDPESMAQDIAKYGLFTAEEFSDYLAPELFDMFNGAYFKVLVGRGTLTYEDIFKMIEISPIE